MGWLRRNRLCGVLLVAFAASAAAAAEGDEEQPSPLEQLGKQLVGMQKNLKSVSTKLRLGLGGAGSGHDVRRRTTPVEDCCMSNIERLRAHARRLFGALDRLHAHYAGRGDAEALGELDEILRELNTVARGVEAMRMTRTVPQAEQAWQGLLRPFNRLRKGIERLERCCPLDEAPAETRIEDGTGGHSGE